MDIIFTERKKYELLETKKAVRARINAIAEKKWFDNSDNLTGNFNSEDTFTFTTFFNLLTIGNGGYYSKPAYLIGKLKKDSSGTTILVKCRPNLVLVFLLYLTAILFLFELFGIGTFLEAPRGLVLLLLPFFIFIQFIIIRSATRQLINKFESVTNVNKKTKAH